MLVASMASTQTGRRYSALAEDCEPLTLLHMEAEYIGFMISIESETRLLRHIRGCGDCKAKLRSIYAVEREPTDELEELFAIDLQEKLLNSSSMLDVPLKANYTDPNAYIDARIEWRLDKLQSILTTAELELKNLGERIKAGKQLSP
jgi:hypothetical protein